MTIKFYKTVCASIVALFFSGSPFTIAWLVISVIVFSLNGMFGGWFFSHIGNEVRKVLPAFANGNTACAIVFIAFCSGVFASLPHGEPCMVCGRFAQTMGRIGYFALPGSSFTLQTPARFSITGTERSVLHHQLVAAIAFTQYVGILTVKMYRAFRSANNNKTAKTMPINIYYGIMAFDKFKWLALNVAILFICVFANRRGLSATAFA